MPKATFFELGVFADQWKPKSKGPPLLKAIILVKLSTSVIQLASNGVDWVNLSNLYYILPYYKTLLRKIAKI